MDALCCAMVAGLFLYVTTATPQFARKTGLSAFSKKIAARLKEVLPACRDGRIA
jgi:hypothetical protein